MNNESTLSDSVDVRRVARAVALLVLLIVVFVFVASAIPQLVGADQSYVVLSDSMSPSIKAGAVVFVSDVPADRIQQDDVITFNSGADNTGVPVTHRVVERHTRDGQPSFVTKGDANEDPDPSPVPASAVVGKVGYHIPLIGYVVSFANTQLGLLALLVLPAGILLALELRDLWRAANDEGGNSENEEIL